MNRVLTSRLATLHFAAMTEYWRPTICVAKEWIRRRFT